MHSTLQLVSLTISSMFRQHVNITLSPDLMFAASPVRYLLIYKLSKDHLELLFGAVRSAGGFNNNQSDIQFAASHRRLLMRHTNERAGGGGGGGGRGQATAQHRTTPPYLIM